MVHHLRPVHLLVHAVFLSCAPAHSRSCFLAYTALTSVRHVALAFYIRRRSDTTRSCECTTVGPSPLLCSALLCSAATVTLSLCSALLASALRLCSLLCVFYARYSARLRSLSSLAHLCSSVRYSAHSCGRVRPQQFNIRVYFCHH